MRGRGVQPTMGVAGAVRLGAGHVEAAMALAVVDVGRAVVSGADLVRDDGLVGVGRRHSGGPAASAQVFERQVAGLTRRRLRDEAERAPARSHVLGRSLAESRARKQQRES